MFRKFLNVGNLNKFSHSFFGHRNVSSFKSQAQEKAFDKFWSGLSRQNKIYNALIQGRPAINANTLLWEGIGYMEMGEYGGALTCFRELSLMDPKFETKANKLIDQVEKKIDLLESQQIKLKSR
jgi:hypothetical protein